MNNVELQLTSKIVAAYVSNNQVNKSDLPTLISSVSDKLIELSSSKDLAVNKNQKPAVPIKKSLNDDYIVCLEDGLRFKSMKRHLRNKYGMSPAQYRAKWGLPEDYPMVAPSYSLKRSALAKQVGLGRKRVADGA